MVLKLPTVFTRIRFTNSVKKFGLAWRCIRGGQQGGLCYHHEIAFPLKSMAKRAMRNFAGADSTFGGCLGEDYAEEIMRHPLFENKDATVVHLGNCSGCLPWLLGVVIREQVAKMAAPWPVELTSIWN